ncbi:hypothetical protein BGZ58_005983, partial [Dissophora ornata]
VTSSPASSTPGSFPGSSAQAASSVPTPRSLEIDESQPVTSITVRLADGSRMVARFNHTHTVNDIRGFINASTPGESSRPYVLQTSYPKKDLVDVDQTIEQAGLLKSLVLQRYFLEDGPLMSYTDPANREFLDAISRGQAPLKYLNIKPGQPVEMRLSKRMEEDFKEPPKAPPKAFEGAGNRL